MNERLKEILATMDIPEMRQDINNESNLRWLQRNLAIRNGAHAEAGEALLIIRDLLRLLSQ
jgi:hypothetical protein